MTRIRLCSGRGQGYSYGYDYGRYGDGDSYGLDLLSIYPNHKRNTNPYTLDE